MKNSRQKRKIFIIIGLLIMSLIGFRFIWMGIHQQSNFPTAKNGILDLRDVDLDSDDVVFLNGEWLFFKNQLINPTLSKEELSRLEHENIQVPRNWKGIVEDEEQKPFGVGTYYLRILLNEEKKQMFSLYFKDIRASSRTYINGEKVAQLGEISEDKALFQADYRPFEVIVNDNASEIRLLIHVANFELKRSGGILKPIQFGSYDAIKKAQVISLLLHFISIFIFLIHFIYALIIFIFYARKKGLLYLAMAFLFGAISILVNDERIILYLFPAISFEWSNKLYYVSYSSAIFFLLYFFKDVFPEFFENRLGMRLIYKLLSYLYSTILAAVLLEFNLIVPILFTVLMVFFPFVIPFLLFKAVLHQKKGSIALLVGMFAIAFSLVWGWIKGHGGVSFPYYPIDVVIGVTGFALFWFSRFFEALDTSESLAKKLQVAAEQKDEFLAITSHELKNPLHGLLNISQLVYETEQSNLSATNRKNLQTIIDIGQRMSLLLSDLLEIDKLKESGIILKTGRVNLSSVVLSVFDMVRFMTEGRNIAFRTEGLEDFPEIKADKNRLFQIVFNLVHNAVKFTNEGEIVVRAEVKGEFALISVKDSGIGMDDKILQNIFSSSKRATISPVEKSGSGLGLSICDQLIKLHGGTLSVESMIGKGTTFTFFLPLASDNKQVQVLNKSDKNTRGHEVEIPAVQKGWPSVLVVDDDPINQEVLKQTLYLEKFNVITASSGEEALQLLSMGSWHLVITDVMMPNMSGYELTKKIRERFSLTELPILLLTAKNQLEVTQTGFHYGANDYIIKPVEKLELVTRIKALATLKDSVDERIRMEAAWLQAQIRPHFLFNTLNSIAALSKTNPVKMIDLLDEFGNYLQASFDVRNLKQVISLKNELELVRSYLFIQKQRFGERLNVIWEVDKGINVTIPPLSIQTIVENAIHHGVLKHPNGGTIIIQVRKVENNVEIMIKDDGIGMSEEKVAQLLSYQTNENGGIGLLNTDKRLRRLYGHGLIIKSNIEVGTIVTFSVPMNY
ncbi:MAG TPA: response regulator [Bacillus bacterium]|nr:response regulator [Bacillus sp. (in: firmicutes)]